MLYYIEIPFGYNDDKERPIERIGDDIIHIEGHAFMTISGRQFERVTKAFREHGWPHQILGLGDTQDSPGEKPVAIVVMAPTFDLPGRLWALPKMGPE